MASAQDPQAAALYNPAGIKFAPCAENKTLDCGTLTVPMDYHKPHGEKVGIAVIRARATNPAKRIGVVVGNPGGPGVSGVDFVLGGIQVPAFARLRERFDVVSFDPRGVARSRGITCNVDLPDIPFDADDATLAAALDNVSRLYAQACLDQNGPFVNTVGTNNVARDMDMLRRALGERQITYAAGSYGSELGAVYASLFPERVRAMLLDGGIGPEFRDNFVEFWSEYSGGFELSFQHVDAVCHRDPQCRLADTGLVAAFDDVFARLKLAPMTAPNGQILTAFVMSDIVSRLLQREGSWPLMVAALADAQAGNFSLLFQLMPVINGGASGDALFAVLCNDYGTRRSATEYLPVDDAVGARNPRFFGRFFVATGVAPCTAWAPADTPVIRDVRHEIDQPILIIGNHFDPNTPLADARSMAHALGMERSLVRYTGGGHTAFAKTTQCIQDVIESYLFDLRLPPEGFSCPGQTVSFGPSLSLQWSTSGSGDVVPQDLWSAPAITSGPFANLKPAGH